MKTEFQRIYLTPIEKIAENKSERPKLPGKRKILSKKTILFTGISLIVVILMGFVSLVLPIRNVMVTASKLNIQVKEAYAAVKNQNLEGATEKLKTTETTLKELDNQLNSLAWVGMIPFIGAYQKDAKHLTTAGIAGVEAGIISVDALIPYSDLLGLKGKSTFVSGSADERIQMAVATLDKLTPKTDEIAAKISIVGSELNKIDPDRYPERVGSLSVRSNLKSAREIFAQTMKLFVDAQPLIKNLPAPLGSSSPTTYLIIFQNDAELRATGGFITAYAVAKIDKGKIKIDTSDDIYDLDKQKKKQTPAPSSIIKYHLKVNTLELRDNNLSPDYVQSMKDFEKMLNDTVPGFPKFDGIIAVDTHVLVSAVKILGEFNISGRKLSAENDKRCDCPKVIYELEDYSTRPVAYVREERKDILGSLLYQIMQRALGVSPSKYWSQLFQMLIDESMQKHILFYLHNDEAQKSIEALNWGGTVTAYEKDYLHINNVNFAGAKSNLFVKQTVKQEIEINSSGLITKTLTILYKNPTAASNCNLEAGQLCLNGILRNWIRIYVPQGAKLKEFKGSEKETVTYDELGKTVFEGFLTVKPQGISEVKVSYTLPLKWEKGKPYDLLIQKQPGTDQYEYEVIYNGRSIEKFPLLTDKKISFKT